MPGRTCQLLLPIVKQYDSRKSIITEEKISVPPDTIEAIHQNKIQLTVAGEKHSLGFLDYTSSKVNKWVVGKTLIALHNI